MSGENRTELKEHPEHFWCHGTPETVDDVFGMSALEIEMMMAQKFVIPVGNTGYRMLFTRNAINGTWTCTTTDVFMNEIRDALEPVNDEI